MPGDHSADQKAALERVEAAEKRIKELEERLNKPGQTADEEKIDRALLETAQTVLAQAIQAAQALGLDPTSSAWVVPPRDDHPHPHGGPGGPGGPGRR